MENNNVRHLTTNDPQPSPLCDSGKLRVYSMRYCANAECALLALYQKGIDFELVNVNMSNKPAWFTDVSPLGKLPVVEFVPSKDSAPKRIFGSDVTAEMVDKMFPGKFPLFPQNPLQEAEGKCFKTLFDAKVLPPLFKATTVPSVEERKQLLSETVNAMRELENYFVGNLFILPGNEPSFVDIMLWPYVERFEPVAEAIGATKDDISLASLPKWKAWKKAMEATKGVKKAALSHEELVEFTKKFMTNNDDRYD